MDSINFGEPDYFYLLALVPLLGLLHYLGYLRRRTRLESIQGVQAKNRWKFRKASLLLKGILILLASASVVIALARPRWGYEWVEVKRRGIDLVLAVDVSRSMLAQDISPSRLERSKRKIIDFMSLIGGDRVGLVAFAGTAYVQCPLTEDHGALRMFLDYLDPDLIPVQGTDLKQAISVSLRALEEGGQGTPKGRAIILISDGEATESHGEQISEAIKLAQKAGVVVYTVGVGTQAGGPIPDISGSFKKDSQGNVVITRPDEDALKKIAEETGGFFVRSVADDIDLRQIYFEGIRKTLEEKDIKSSHDRDWFERFQWFVGFALALFTLEMLMGDVVRGGMMIVFFLALSGPDAFGFSLPELWGKGHGAFERGEFDKSTEQFLKQEIENPEDPGKIYNRAVSQYRQGNYKDAAQGFAKSSAMTQEPELSKKSLFNAGNAYVGLGDLEKAIAAYEGVLQMDPENQKAKENLEYVKNLKNQKNDKNQDSPPKGDEKNQSHEQEKNQNSSDSKGSQQGTPPTDDKGQENQESRKNQENQENQQGQNGGQEEQPPPQPKEPSNSQDEKVDQGQKSLEKNEPKNSSSPEKSQGSTPSQGADQPQNPKPNQAPAAAGEFSDQQIESILNSVKDQASKYLLQPPDREPPRSPQKDW